MHIDQGIELIHDNVNAPAPYPVRQDADAVPTVLSRDGVKLAILGYLPYMRQLPPH